MSNKIMARIIMGIVGIIIWVRGLFIFLPKSASGGNIAGGIIVTLLGTGLIILSLLDSEWK